tara:strand:+ start:463 stop:1053 length:591 start_codon:yes stop_codon:yes gene_type:complete
LANKRKCKYCLEYFPPEKIKRFGVGYFCSIEHALQWVKEKQAKDKARKLAKEKKAVKQKHAKEKRAFYDGDVKTRKAAAKAACHKYIRERDKNDGCICCDRQLGNKFDAGHFLESGNNSFLRYHEDNIHAQSVHCNQYKGGDSGDYERNLRMKIGDDRVDYLLANKGGVVKRTAEDYKEIEVMYKEKLKKLINNEG